MARFACILIYNKYNSYFTTYINNYFGNLSHKTFFQNANPTGFQSFSSRSVFNLFELPLIIVGLFFLLKQKNKALKILIPWILIAPISASFTGVNNYGRINLIMPAFQIIAAIGAVSILSTIKTKYLKTAVSLIFVFFIFIALIKFYSDAFFVEPYYNSRHERYGYKQLFNYLKTRENDYDNFYISLKIDNSHQYIQYLYFQKVSPKYYLENVIRRRGKDSWIEFNSIGIYHFVSSIPQVDAVVSKSLFIAGENEINVGVTPIKIFYDLKEDTLFEVYDVDAIREKLSKEISEKSS